MKNYPKIYNNDIKVLGRVVSIATENKVAAAEQVFDEKFKYIELDSYSWDNVDLTEAGLDQYTINRLFGKKLKKLDDNIKFDDENWIISLKVRTLTAGNIIADNIETNNLNVKNTATIKNLILNNLNLGDWINQINRVVSGEDRTSVLWDEITALRNKWSNEFLPWKQTVDSKLTNHENRISHLEECCEQVRAIIDNLPTGAGDASFTVSPKLVELTVGENALLTVTKGADLTGTVRYSSNNSSIATVNASGRITAVAAGETTITVSVDGFRPTQDVRVVISRPIDYSFEITGYPSQVKVGNVNQCTVTYNDPEATDYSTIHWSWTPQDAITTNGTATGRQINFTAAKSYQDVTITASNGTNSDSITFTTYHDLVYMDDATQLGKQEVVAGSTISPITSPTKSGYTFSGWANMPANGKMPANDLTVTAQWTQNAAPKYTLTYNDGNTTLSTQQYEAGQTITPIADPTKSGYTFNGWSPSVPATMPANNLTVIAQWTEIHVYTLSVDPTSTTITAGNTATITATPKDNGTAMSGQTITWSSSNPSAATVSNGVVTAITEGTATITATWTSPDGNKTATCAVTVTAEPTYTLTFDTAGGSAIAARTYKAGATIEAVTNPTKEGYNFTGWNPAIPATMPAENLTVVAQWELIPIEYELIIVGDNRTVTSGGSPITLTAVKREKISHNVASIEGTVQWSTSKDIVTLTKSGSKDVNALITAKEIPAGTTDETVITASVDGLTAEAGVSVTAEPVNMDATGVTLNPKDVYVTVGHFEGITTNKLPTEDHTGTLSYTIADPTICEFGTDSDNQPTYTNVVGKAVGDTTVTVTLTNSSNQTFSDSITVHVLPEHQDFTEQLHLQLLNEGEIHPGDTVQVKVTSTPSIPEVYAANWSNYYGSGKGAPWWRLRMKGDLEGVLQLQPTGNTQPYDIYAASGNGNQVAAYPTGNSQDTVPTEVIITFLATNVGNITLTGTTTYSSAEDMGATNTLAINVVAMPIEPTSVRIKLNSYASLNNSGDFGNPIAAERHTTGFPAYVDADNFPADTVVTQQKNGSLNYSIQPLRQQDGSIVVPFNGDLKISADVFEAGANQNVVWTVNDGAALPTAQFPIDANGVITISGNPYAMNSPYDAGYSEMILHCTSAEDSSVTTSVRLVWLVAGQQQGENDRYATIFVVNDGDATISDPSYTLSPETIGDTNGTSYDDIVTSNDADPEELQGKHVEGGWTQYWSSTENTSDPIYVTTSLPSGKQLDARVYVHGTSMQGQSWYNLGNGYSIEDINGNTCICINKSDVDGKVLVIYLNTIDA